MLQTGRRSGSGRLLYKCQERQEKTRGLDLGENYTRAQYAYLEHCIELVTTSFACLSFVIGGVLASETVLDQGA